MTPNQRLRLAIIKRWGTTCWWCRNPIDLELVQPHPWCFTKDHLVPRSRGGKSVLSNYRPAHRYCNMQRGNPRIVKRGNLNVF